MTTCFTYTICTYYPFGRSSPDNSQETLLLLTYTYLHSSSRVELERSLFEKQNDKSATWTCCALVLRLPCVPVYSLLLYVHCTTSAENIENSLHLSRLFWSGQKGQCFRSVKLLDPKSGSKTIFYVKALAHKGTKSSRGRRKSRTSKVSRAFLMCYLLLQQEVLNPLCDVSFSIVC